MYDDEDGHYYIVTEYCGGPEGTIDLFGGLILKETFEEEEARRVMKVILNVSSIPG